MISCLLVDEEIDTTQLTSFSCFQYATSSSNGTMSLSLFWDPFVSFLAISPDLLAPSLISDKGRQSSRAYQGYIEGKGFRQRAADLAQATRRRPTRNT